MEAYFSANGAYFRRCGAYFFSIRAYFQYNGAYSAKIIRKEENAEVLAGDFNRAPIRRASFVQIGFQPRWKRISPLMGRISAVAERISSLSERIQLAMGRIRQTS
ncbi:hypothetical protein QMA09_04625 [Planococcus sp. APC 3906]|uniref:hypothetical protein n=1 Tax=Planococcus sp. APC 3906 TaxID=3035194 RepID=UPI0025B3259C|nr:hypothetical protein [Planococcus sp. APC 3906]MDN3449462.1 hypothetical protein [Planococcus sp. APC 3906]